MPQRAFASDPPSPSSNGSLAPLHGLLDAARAAASGRDLQPVLDAIARAISVSLGFRSVVINLHRPASDDFEVVTVLGDEEARRALLGTTRPWASWQPLLAPRFERCGTYLISRGEYDRDADGASYVPPAGGAPDPAAWHPEDALLVALRSASGHLLGVVSVDQPADGLPPSDAQLELLSAFAAQAAIAVEHARTTADADRNRAAVQHLLRISARLTGGRSADDVLTAVCEGIREALGFRRVIVALTEGPDHRLALRSSAGWDEVELAKLPPVPLSAISRLLRPEHQVEGCVLLSQDEAEALTPPELHGVFDRRRDGGGGPLAWRAHWLIVPLHDGNGAFCGIVWVDDPEDRLLPTTERLQALRAFANQATSAVESARRLEHLRHLAEHDPLTGLRNRRDFEPRIQRAIDRSRRQSAVSVLVCDLDNFKRVNDTLGHEAGDEVLRRFADLLLRSTRGSDVPTRLGGEEFAVVLRDTSDDDALAVAERLRHSVREDFADFPTAVSVSIGLAASGPELATAEEVLRAANRALQAAKRLGRDRSVPYQARTIGMIERLRHSAETSAEQLAAAILLAETIDLGDPGTVRHAQTVGQLAERIGRQLGWAPGHVERLRAAGVLHDIGKLGIPVAMMLKPDALDEHEWREMRRHPEIGARILEHANLRDIAGWVRAHHERVDGSGYPRGLAHEAIPPEARVLAVADAWEAMTSDRPYQRGMSADDAEAELRRGAGSQFDPQIVEALLAALAASDLSLTSPV